MHVLIFDYSYDFVSRSFYKLPGYFAKTKYQNPSDASNGPFQYAYDTKLNGFAWVMQPENAELFTQFNTFMSGSHEAHWLDWFPVKERMIDGLDRDANAVTMVDVGGNLGHELLDLKKRYPDLSGRLVLQDLPQTIKSVPETGVFEAMAHDFFAPQPVKSRYNFIRLILHSSQAQCSDTPTHRRPGLLLPSDHA